MGLFIAGHANEAHLGIRNHGQGWVHHAQPGADDRHDNGRVLQARALCGRNRGGTVEVLHGKTAGCFVYEHGAQVFQCGAESGVIAARIAHEGKAGGGKRVVYYVDVHDHHFKLFGNQMGHRAVQ